MSKNEDKTVVIETKPEDNPIIELTPPLKEFFDEQVNYLAQRQFNSMYWSVALVAIEMGKFPTKDEVIGLGAAIATDPDAYVYNRETSDNPNQTTEPGDTGVLERRAVTGKVYEMLIQHSNTFLEMNAILPEFKRQGIHHTKSLDEMYAETLTRAKESTKRNQLMNDATEIMRRKKLTDASTSVKPAICE